MFKEPALKKRKLDSSDSNASKSLVEEKIDTTALKRLIKQFEKAVNTNLEERSKHANNPEKFMDSEINLDTTVKQLQEQFVPNVELYGSFVKWGGVELLLSLLTHENTDIMLDVLDMISEFTESDSLRENEQEATILIKKLV
jgi:beta-catenin-like protein 1